MFPLAGGRNILEGEDNAASVPRRRRRCHGNADPRRPLQVPRRQVIAPAVSGEGVVFDPQQVVGPYVGPTVGAYDPARHLMDTGVPRA